MLALDDYRWSSLGHAYGKAANIPDLLRQLAGSSEPKAGHSEEPWFSLWSALCHQGDVYDASYAALPHIVEIACRTTKPIDKSFFLLPAAIEIARCNGSGPVVPVFLEASYTTGFRRLSEAVMMHSHRDLDQDELQCLLSALAAAKGKTRLAEAIMELDEHIITKIIEQGFD